MQLVPFHLNERRADYRVADLQTALWNIAIAKSGSKTASPRQPHEFWRQWGDEPDPKPVKLNAEGKPETMLDRARAKFSTFKDYMLSGGAKPKV